MTPFRGAVACSLALVVLAGCASTEVTERQAYQGKKLARPDRIIAHDVMGDPTEVPPESPFATRPAGTVPPTPEQREVGRKLGDQIASKLVADLHGMGLPAVRAAGQSAPQVDDIVLRSYFVSIDEGSAGQRVLVGFGSGAAEMRAAVEGYQMTAQGPRLLGPVVAGSAKLRGEKTGSDTIEGAAERTTDEIAAQLRTAARQQGWI